MTTPPYAELVAAVRREGEGIVSAAGLGLSEPVPSCADWDVEHLLRHVARIYRYVAEVVSTRATASPEFNKAHPEGDPVDLLEAALDDVVAALSDSDADTPVWNWNDVEPDRGLFWARRMAHESSIHRFDAQSAHGVVQPIDAELAADGLDELLDGLAPGIYSRLENPAPSGTVTFRSQDDGEWHLKLTPTGIQRTEPLAEPDATVTATSNALLLASYHRAPWSALEVTGDLDLLERWTAAMRF